MTLGGWSMMFVMVGVISGLTFWCIAKVLADSASTGIHGPTDVDMPDLHDEDAPCRRAR